MTLCDTASLPTASANELVGQCGTPSLPLTRLLAAGVAALSEWVDLKAAGEDVHTTLEEAVEEHLTVIRKEMRLLMQCFL